MTDRVESKSLEFVSLLKCPVNPVEYRNLTGKASNKHKFNRGNSFRPGHMPCAAPPFNGRSFDRSWQCRLMQMQISPVNGPRIARVVNSEAEGLGLISARTFWYLWHFWGKMNRAIMEDDMLGPLVFPPKNRC